MSQMNISSIILLGLSGVLLLSCHAETKQPPIATGQMDAQLTALWADVLKATQDDKPARKKRQWQMKMTTWLAADWPPSSRTVWIRYAYGLDVSMDGASDVSAPFARIERRAGDDAHVTVIPMASSLKVIAVHPVRPHGGWNYTLDDEKHMLAMALALRGLPPADSRGGIGVKSYFTSWRLANAEIAAHVAPNHRVFFKWLDSLP